MDSSLRVKQLMKIVIGAAWIDGRIQPEERQYLHRIAQEKGLENDPEIQPLLHELVAVQPDQFYEWVEAYLGDETSPEAYQQLIEELSGLIYSDGEVATEEAKLLTRLQMLDPNNEANKGTKNAVLTTIQKLYRRWVGVQN